MCKNIFLDFCVFYSTRYVITIIRVINQKLSTADHADVTHKTSSTLATIVATSRRERRQLGLSPFSATVVAGVVAVSGDPFPATVVARVKA